MSNAHDLVKEDSHFLEGRRGGEPRQNYQQLPLCVATFMNFRSACAAQSFVLTFNPQLIKFIERYRQLPNRHRLDFFFPDDWQTEVSLLTI